MTDASFRYPRAEEMSAFERDARRARAAEMARLVKVGAAAVKAFFTRPAPVRVKIVRHA